MPDKKKHQFPEVSSKPSQYEQHFLKRGIQKILYIFTLLDLSFLFDSKPFLITGKNKRHEADVTYRMLSTVPMDQQQGTLQLLCDPYTPERYIYI